MTDLYVEVLINNQSKNTDTFYTYYVPFELRENVEIGKRVIVSFGNHKKNIDALIINIKTEIDFDKSKVKEILGVYDSMSLLTKDLYKLGFWIRNRYICKYIDIFNLFIPSYLKYDSKENTDKKVEKIRNEVDKKFGDNDFESSFKELNDEQEKCYNEIITSDKNAFLLHGITGSGKTEVYIKLIEYYRKMGKQSILLVPEISLTGQTVNRLKDAFGHRIAILHSKLTPRQKYVEWMKIRRKHVDVVIGPRSAVFTPVENMGVIIVDEEHDSSYLSGQNPKYDCVEVAIRRGLLTNAKVVLGSATPSLQTMKRAKSNKIELLKLSNRANNAKLPSINIVDMTKEIRCGNNTILSRALYISIKKSLENNQQIILLVNRRGYSNFISCRACGEVIKCDRCDVTMTYHSNINKLKCHYCGKTIAAPSKCPTCDSDDLDLNGMGTQQAEYFIKKVFKKAVVSRMDMDSMNNLGNYSDIYENFRNQKIDILIGTQMLAKGFDFPNVTTVGIMNADSIINLPFFDASEKAFELLTQVSGRAGRSKLLGRVYIQTYQPENYIIQMAKNNDYDSFYNYETEMRKNFLYPPYICIINVCLISADEKKVIENSQTKYRELKTMLKDQLYNEGIKVFEPMPNSIYRVNNEYRINTYLKVALTKVSAVKDVIRKVYLSKNLYKTKLSININTDKI